MVSRQHSPQPAPLPTEAELRILQILWEAGTPLTVREVHEALRDQQTGYTTILKQMQMMVEKELLVRNERYRSHLYEARYPREQTQHRLITELVQKAFSGSAKSLVMGALAAKPVSKNELAEIREMLHAFEEKSK
ncbi:BlaI/MecI/CopY family transcriptional regulator [Silvibacterium dinghuense]|uniref:BlaI/MecI/CopY family transcriptional regulator n=1 Tax=Silvibacterium dinghuense TaxID=1560006 RepID=A0A4Q1SGQ0_9BACT|nr:BlaI/MecI/CopY family transcriptional regulator [Silvibacterium dinghuense]RXS96708.1 BlaI/MecI/CopY family transcriptional regulator [Silvibacterium dinghuense]GGG93023.1 transcriptional regulator [Silvibacterium dinghuense]